MHEKHMQHWEHRTFQHWQTLTSRRAASETGISSSPGMYYWDSSASQGRKPEEWIWWTSFIPKYRYMRREEIPVPIKSCGQAQEDDIEGITYESFSISPEMYLKYLMAECKTLGGTMIQGEVASLEDVFALDGCGDAVGVVNCAGVMGTKLVNEGDAFYPTKGQAVVVRGEAKRISTGLGADWEAVVVPRKGLNETFLGVTKIYGVGTLDIDEGATRMILEQAKPLAPELLDDSGNFEVLRVQVGLRPTRTGGARVEIENLAARGKWICHNYGHHGAGFEESFGCAETVVELVSQQLARGDFVTQHKSSISTRL
ncbi:hypothetical protein QQS21_007348 [Conoideocrella luteorostrata]|uniref:FAD dependent oxidoreductase domain-containing protein n=1 Tax=Conoideocrella luteorostrata TaxID=1105319 RepID=A0AAJ0FZJ6_9HYPO|nr:hypothetical protein QQS21_007348 [Conoideocrella luteorostrata]